MRFLLSEDVEISAIPAAGGDLSGQPVMVRTPAGDVMVKASAARLLEKFRSPATAIEAAVRYGDESGEDVSLVLTWAQPWLKAFLRGGVLRPDGAGVANHHSLKPGDLGPNCVVRARVPSRGGAEIYQVRRSSGQIAALKLFSEGPRFAGPRAGGPAVIDHGQWRGRTFELLEWRPGVPLLEAADLARNCGADADLGPRQLATGLRNAVTALHHAGVAHGAILAENVEVDAHGQFTLYDGRPCEGLCPGNLFDQDRQQLAGLLAVLLPGDDVVAGANDASNVPRTAITRRQEAIEQLLQAARPGSRLDQKGFAPPTANLSMGAAGLSLALLGIARARENPEALALALAWSDRSRRAAGPDAFFMPESEPTPATAGPAPLFCGEPGVLVVDALVRDAVGDQPAARRTVDDFLMLGQQELVPYDLTLGRAGLIFGALTLLPLGHQQARLTQLVERQLAGLTPLFAATPGIAADNPNVTMLGLAHGWAGLLYTFLRAHQRLATALPPFVLEGLQALLAMAEPWRRGQRLRRNVEDRAPTYMQGWCNGAAGLVHLYCAAHQVYAHAGFLEAAEAFGHMTCDDAYAAGDLCCGLGGAAVALHELSRCTGLPRWARRAEQLLERAIPTVERSALRRHSLFKGEAGVALIAAEADNARMPIYG